MDCEQALNLISARVDGEIDATDGAELDAHLGVCRQCRETLDELRRQDAELRRAFGPLRQKALSVSAYVEGRLPRIQGFDSHRTKYNLFRMIVSTAAGFLLAVLIFQPWRVPESPRAVVRPVLTEKTRLEVATGPVEIFVPETDAWTNLDQKESISRGSRIRTTTNSRCELLTHDGSLLRLNKDTVLVLQDHRQFELVRGQVWAMVERGEIPFRVQVPAAKTTVTALGTQFDVMTEFNEALVTVVQGSTKVEGLGSDNILDEGEMARMVDGRLAEKKSVGDLVLATRWVHELLVLKSRANQELADRVNDLFARIGKTKMKFLPEEEIRSLGDQCVLPLRSYLHSPHSRRDPHKRAIAARILSDVTQPWFVPEFIELLADEEGEVRYYAARGLTRLTGRFLEKSAEEWRDEPWSSLQTHCDRWRAWWEEHKDHYPSGPMRPPIGRLKASLK